MWIRRKVLIFILLDIYSVNFSGLNANPESTEERLEILLIGSSYFGYNNLPGLFANIVINSGKEVYVDRVFSGGPYLSDHAISSSTEAKIDEREWDFVILQGVGRLTAYPDIYTEHPVYTALKTLQEKISNNCVSTKMVFCLPWAFEDGMTWLEGWTDTYEDMQIKIYNNTLRWSDSLDFIVAPVGWTWYTVLKEENYPLHYLHLSDWNHPSLKGSYLMACVIFSTVYQESSFGNSYFGGLTEIEAEYFQEVASNTVLENLDLWNISTADTNTTGNSILNKFHLYQNYPNPFNPTTTINYHLSIANHVELSVYNLLGEKVKTLVNQRQEQGTYPIEFDGSTLPSGLYFYQISAGNFKAVRKMILVK